MRFHKILAVVTLLASVSLIGSCAIPQPRFECNTLAPFFAFYTLEEGDPASSCGGFGGDYLQTQRYLAPNSTDARLALLPYRVGYLTGLGNSDPDDPKGARESSIGHFETLLPDDDGVCRLVNVADGRQNFRPLLNEDGDEVEPSFEVTYKWDSVRVLSTAEFPGTLIDGKVTITQTDSSGSCTAKYGFYGVHTSSPATFDIVVCDPLKTTMRDGQEYNPDCDANADPANDRPLGAGTNAAYQPRCIKLAGSADEASSFLRADLSPSTDPDYHQMGICGPTLTIDQLLSR